MSHLQGTNYVGSMVVFEDALAKKSDYRHFNVKEILGNDDAGAMQEVVRRRLGYWNEEQAQSKFRRANLIIIDGGLPQLHAAEKAAADAGAGRAGRVRGPGQARGIALPAGIERADRPRPRLGELSTSSSASATRRTASPSRFTAPSAPSRWSRPCSTGSRDSAPSDVSD